MPQVTLRFESNKSARQIIIWRFSDAQRGSSQPRLTGAAHLLRPRRGSRRRGSIIDVASILALRQGSQVATYATSKAGVVQMTKVMALELAR